MAWRETDASPSQIFALVSSSVAAFAKGDGGDDDDDDDQEHEHPGEGAKSDKSSMTRIIRPPSEEVVPDDNGSPRPEHGLDTVGSASRALVNKTKN